MQQFPSWSVKYVVCSKKNNLDLTFNFNRSLKLKNNMQLFVIAVLIPIFYLYYIINLNTSSFEIL